MGNQGLDWTEQARWRRRGAGGRRAGPPASGGTGWAIRTRCDPDGRTSFSVYVGDTLLVEDQPNPESALAAARRLLNELGRTQRAPMQEQ